ncbi:hypothetical protein AWC11_01655 [Mycobacterium interjectum]|nr:hypothetical protein AWC11_01655 [Mycobacterium interjectum]
MIRPAEHLVHGLDGPVAVVDGRVCHLLNRMLSLDKFRVQVRGQDAQLDHTLMAIKLAATAFAESSAAGTHAAPRPEPEAPSKRQLNDTVSTTTAATILGITDRAVRKAIAEKRLPATLLDGRYYRVARDDLAAYAATR